jgi:hypothetical protein
MSKRRLPHRFAPGLFALLTSGLMSLLVSGVATWKALSFVPDFASRWMVAWGNAWPIAFATLLVIAPFVRRLVAMLVEPPPAVPDARARNGA